MESFCFLVHHMLILKVIKVIYYYLYISEHLSFSTDSLLFCHPRLVETLQDTGYKEAKNWSFSQSVVFEVNVSSPK